MRKCVPAPHQIHSISRVPRKKILLFRPFSFSCYVSFSHSILVHDTGAVICKQYGAQLSVAQNSVDVRSHCLFLPIVHQFAHAKSPCLTSVRVCCDSQPVYSDEFRLLFPIEMFLVSLVHLRPFYKHETKRKILKLLV